MANYSGVKQGRALSTSSIVQLSSWNCLVVTALRTSTKLLYVEHG